jgi:hypothetical protein
MTIEILIHTLHNIVIEGVIFKREGALGKRDH